MSPLLFVVLMDLKEKIIELVNKNLGSPEFFIVDVNVSGSQNVRKISILLDGDSGISIDECAKVSRIVGKELEEFDMIDSQYLLEVGSPGLDKPLKLKRQYLRNLGKRVAVVLEDETTKTGVLENVGEDQITLLEEVKEKSNENKNSKKVKTISSEIPFSSIKKTNVLVSFS